MEYKLERYAAELETELENILSFWVQHSIDELNGGFVGKISNDNEVDHQAAKGSVLNARILWSFSAAYNSNPQQKYISIANLAYSYISNHFIDAEFGSVYWLLDSKGNPLDTKKQIYALAFTIYALSEYYLACKEEQVKEKAIALYRDLVKYSFDTKNGGYFEAFDRAWKTLDDLRLSDKDANESKSMNTHLHVLEAFTTLYRIWPDKDLKERIATLIGDFEQHIVDAKTGNLILFFDENWNAKSNIISYGHDIEASWLLLEAAEVIQDAALVADMKKLAVKMAEVSLKGLAEDGSLWYEYDYASGHIIKEKHWWVQAEAMVGFFNAWQISEDEKFLAASLSVWKYVQENIIDHKNGEWFWGRNEQGEIMPNEDKAGIWKCPYHNSRCCMEILSRIKNLSKKLKPGS